MEAGRVAAVRSVASPIARELAVSSSATNTFHMRKRSFPIARRSCWSGPPGRAGTHDIMAGVCLFPAFESPGAEAWEHLSAQADSSTATEL